MERDQTRRRRKLLVASVGVATVSYALLSACGKDNVPTTGNLPAPPPSVTPITGNLPAPPPPPVDAGPADATPADAGPALPTRHPISGNLPAPPPPSSSPKPTPPKTK